MQATTVSQAPAAVGRAVVLTIFSAALAAVTLALGVWVLLPYETLERFTAPEQFRLWEGVVWMAALILIFLGAACVVERVGWRVTSGVASLRDRMLSARSARQLLLDSAAVPWWMMVCGAVLAIIAAIARLQYIG